jgi:hypothetical protein
MKTILQLVDTVSYVRANCFQHQLAASLNEVCNLVQIELRAVLNHDPQPFADGIISCLKQRTVDRHLVNLQRWLDGRPIVIYDQDPWQAYMDDSPYKGTYDRVIQALNVKTFALTTQWWVDFLHTRGLPSTFVRMWVLPQYCVSRSSYLDRTKLAGFVGSVHPRRQVLLAIIEGAGIKTSVLHSNSLSYDTFLHELSKLRCFIHNEDMPVFVDGQQLNFNTGMWVKDVEAASQGCFSIRGKGEGSETYLDALGTVLLYDDISQTPDIINNIEKMDPNERQSLIDRTVEHIRQSNKWQETAFTLIGSVT